MRGSRVRFLTSLAITAVAAIMLSSAACAVSWPVWPAYHADMVHNGRNSSATDIDNPASLGLVWVFPRADADYATEEDSTVDNFRRPGPEPPADIKDWFYQNVGKWQLDYSEDAYEVDDTETPRYYYLPVVPADWQEDAVKEKNDYTSETKDIAVWKFPYGDQIRKSVTLGYYRVWVWVPVQPEAVNVGEPTYTTKAIYKVHDDTGVTEVSFDQTEGGTWQLLTDKQFSFRDEAKAGQYYVELSNITGDTYNDILDADGNEKSILVVADAIKFAKGTGMEIYSSPVSATIDYNWTSPSGTTSYTGKSPVVYVGTVEPPLANSTNAPDMGAIYCIDSVTPTDQPSDGSGYEDLSKKLGEDIWRYPHRVDETHPTRDPLEGPIEGGIYSSPTLAHVTLTTGGNKLICYVSGMDRQIYALDAETGDLLWKGPGVTVTETPSADWPTVLGRDDAFGGQFCHSTGGANMQWDFDRVRDDARGGSTGDGWAYAIYAWMPPMRSGEAARTTVKYIINHQGSKDSVDVKINQALPENQGRWVKIGSSYFNVDFVTLEATPGAVADAMMIVPDTIGPFGYCSPIADVGAPLEKYPTTEGTYNAIGGGDILADHIYVVTSNGRALSFAAGGSDKSEVDPDRKCLVEWVYPAIRTSKSVTGSGTDDMPSMGQIGASPAYYDGPTGKLLFIAGYDGKVHCVNAINGEKMWIYEDTQSGSDPFGGPMGLGGFTSSPTIDVDNAQLFIGSTAGYFYCLNAAAAQDASQSDIFKWRYPSASGVEPLGAFRYSTAVVGDSPYGTRMHRVWIGSSDGHIYTFDATPTAIWPDRRLWVENVDQSTRIVHGPAELEYIEPSLLSPIQGSIACDGASSTTTKSGGGNVNNTMTMYVGDMNGQLHWYSADSGRSDWTVAVASGTSTVNKNYTSYQTEGELFSSPNVTQVTASGVPHQMDYVYVGCADGRIYAFSNDGGAWGGKWAGGYWPFPGDSDSDERKIEKLPPDAEVQFDIFTSDFFDRSNNYDPEPKLDSDYLIPTDPSTDWTNSQKGGAWIVSEGMKMPTGITSNPTDDDINDALRTAALDRRDWVFRSAALRQDSTEPIYLEWGETMNLVLWNLPELSFLAGTSNSSKRGSIRINMTNTSAGESGGSQVRMAGRIRQLKEYTVLEESTKTNTGLNDTATPLKYSNGSDVKRSYALATIEINSSGRRPPSPGPGWTLTAEIRIKTSSTSKTYTTRIIPIARLILGGSGELEPFVDVDGNYQEQKLGINNPLAVRDDRTSGPPAIGEALAWPKLTGYKTDSEDDQAHYNGNAIYDGTTAGVMPIMDLLVVNHGAASREGWLGVMDRSATGMKIERGSAKTLNNFRISAGELRFNGGDEAIKNSGGTKFPWEFGAGSVDYPSINKQHQGYRKATDDGDPANAPTALPPIVVPSGAADYKECILRPETVFVSVDVPRFQPANCGNTGYSRDMEAFIDSNRNGQWDSGNVIIGRPSTYQEAYRRFIMGVKVPPDPKIEVEEKMIDVGRAPHGLGEGLTGNYEFSPYNPTADIRQWFKTVTIKNAGNVNLPNMYIGRTTKMFSDQAGAISPIPEGAITSSLDYVVPPAFTLFKDVPFTSVNTDGSYLGYTLTKARVGDPDPSVMTIPDKRKWDMNYGGANDGTEAALIDLNTAFTTDLRVDQPLPVKVGVRVPLTQPIGGYYSFDARYRLPYVPVFADTNLNGVLDPTLEPVAEASFQLKAAVRENQLTGGVTPMTLPQIDIPDSAGLTPRVGDATPAAFRDLTTGDVHLFWSSNRMFDETLYPDWGDPTDPTNTEFANAPWFINWATLDWQDGWKNAGTDPNRWWTIPAAGGSPQLPMIQWPTLEGSGSDPKLMQWTFNGASTGFYSVRHHSPVIAQTLTSTKAAETDQTWLAWVGTADMKDPGGNKITQDHIIHYRNATGGTVTGADSYISHDPSMVKRSPSLSIYGNRMWMFWQGGNNGNWSIMYSTNDDPSHAPGAWADDATLVTPSCLTSVSSPNCIFRRFWGNLTGDTPDYAVGKQLLDIVYAGTSKFGQSPDILLGRYVAANQKDVINAPDAAKSAIESAKPCNMAQPLPRVFNEQLRRDSKYSYFTSQHLAWIRPDIENSVEDNWGASTLDVPYIHVVFPVGYELPQPGGATIPVGTEAIVSATDGRVIVDGSTLVAPQPLVPIYDEATGIYTYKYPDEQTSAILGEMLVDFSAGVIRFTQPLNEVKPTGKDYFISPSVVADYTPRTWRLTTDAAVDNSPRAFIERSNMNKTAYPGMCDWTSTNGGAKPAPVDRLWVFWRKAGTGVNTSTIYYKTYRVGVDLAKLGHKPIPVATDYSFSGASPGQVLPAAHLDVQNELGPWEVNRTGTKIYFTEVDERYKSLASGSWDVLGPGPANPIKITYEPVPGEKVEITPDIYWIEEMPEQSLFGFSADGNVNEGSIYAFYDPDPKYYTIDYQGSGTWAALPSSKIWVFWTSTRGGTSDLFWETLSPSFAAD